MALAGKQVCVLGGTSGIGLGVAQAFMARGASVTIGGRDADRLAACGATGYIVNLNDDESTKAFFKKFQDESLDFVVCTAGGSAFLGDLIENRRTLADIRRQVDLKLAPQLAAVLHGHPKVKSEGAFVLTSGILAMRPGGGNTGLAMMNAAIECAVKGLANDLGKHRRIRINAVSPGLTMTPFFDAMGAERRDAYFAKAAASSPIKRTGTVQELADFYIAVATNTFVTGQTLVCDGGFLSKA